MSLNGISRIEEYFPVESEDAEHDPMLQRMYNGIDQNVFTVNHEPEPIKYVDDLEKYNEEEGLALSEDEMAYLHKLEKENGRPLTDSEIFGFAQINSEHCRHKIFGGQFIIDGKEMESSLFNMIKKTTNENPNKILSAYKDNVAFSQGPVIEQFAPADQTTSDFFQVKDIESVISLKAETHNFPTTVEPFNGAATGTGGEIRDRMGGGVGSWPIAGTACYMTAYPRLKDDNGKSDIERDWEDIMPVRKWLYQTPEQILIKASNGASDFGNKFGQPLITGSVLTFEHEENGEKYAYDKVIMLAGGVGYGKKRDYKKGEPQKGNKVVVVGGDNYRIGLGGGSVSSVDTGRYSNGIELNAVQRANPEMQKRVLQMEAVACKDWLTNKVDRSVTGKIARQQCQGQIQLPLSDCGVVALDYRGEKGIVTAMGHAPQAGLADPKAGSVLSVAESLTNIVWAPLADGMDSISLSANWMWPCRSQKGEDARLYEGVKALSDFCCAIHVNVPTGKDSLSLTQQYPNGEKIIAPGTVIVSAGGEVSDVKKVVSPVLVNDKNSSLYHIDFSFDEQRLGGSAFAQSLGKVGSDVPTVKNPEYFVDCFNAVQELINRGWVMAGHDISAGGLITTLLEMTFANVEGGMKINLHDIADKDIIKTLFAENPGVVIQVSIPR